MARSAQHAGAQGPGRPDLARADGAVARSHRTLKVEPFPDLTLSAEVRRWDYLENLAGALSASAPALVLLEDLHWADPTAIWVLHHLPQAVEGSPIAFVATSREHEPDMPPLEDLRRASRVITLEGLDVDAVRQLALAETAGSNDRPIDAVDLHARTGGNPLFVQEVVRSPDGGGVVSELLQGLVHAIRRADPAGAGDGRCRRARHSPRADRDRDRPVQRRPRREFSTRPSARGYSTTSHREVCAFVIRCSPRLPLASVDTHPLDARLASAWEARGRPRRPGLGRRPPSASGDDSRRIADAVATTCDVAADRSLPTLTARSLSPSDRPSPTRNPATGSRPFPERSGSPSCGSTDR